MPRLTSPSARYRESATLIKQAAGRLQRLAGEWEPGAETSTAVTSRARRRRVPACATSSQTARACRTGACSGSIRTLSHCAWARTRQTATWCCTTGSATACATLRTTARTGRSRFSACGLIRHDHAHHADVGAIHPRLRGRRFRPGFSKLVRPANRQGPPASKALYATVLLVTDTGQGVDYNIPTARSDNDLDVETVRTVRAQYSVQWFRKGARDSARRFAAWTALVRGHSGRCRAPPDVPGRVGCAPDRPHRVGRLGGACRAGPGRGILGERDPENYRHRECRHRLCA